MNFSEEMLQIIITYLFLGLIIYWGIMIIAVKIMAIVVTDTVLDRIEKRKQRKKFHDGTELRVRY